MVSARRMVRSPITWAVAAVVVIVLGVGLPLAQPWKLFTDTTVDEAAPTASVPATGTASPERPVVLARGALRSHEHHTSGTVTVLLLADGSRVLRLEDLDTSDGPDVHVWLTDRPITDSWFGYDEGAHVDLGKLKGNKGNQNYPLPAGIDPAAYGGVSLWCDRFDVSFGAATLAPV